MFVMILSHYIELCYVLTQDIYKYTCYHTQMISKWVNRESGKKHPIVYTFKHETMKIYNIICFLYCEYYYIFCLQLIPIAKHWETKNWHDTNISTYIYIKKKLMKKTEIGITRECDQKKSRFSKNIIYIIYHYVKKNK